jgi:Na+-driven multidrug efflux pump
MLVVTLILQFHPELLVAFFTDEEPVIKAGGDFLQIISWNFVAQGIIFTCSGMFQGLGNTKPAMFSSASRLVIFIPIAIWVSNQESFTMEKIWYVSVLSVTIQAVISFLLIRKEFSLKLSNLEAPSPAAPTTVEQQA